MPTFRKVTVPKVRDTLIAAMDLRASVQSVSRETLLLALWEKEFEQEEKAIQEARKHAKSA